MRALLTLLSALHLALAPVAASTAQRPEPLLVTSALLADVQTFIGDQGLTEGSAGHMLLHGLAGCAFNQASGADCAAGFAAGAVGSLYAGYLHQNGIGADDPAIGQYLNTAELLGAFAGYVFSSGQGENVSLGGSVAQSGVENNYLTHAQLEAMIAAFERCDKNVECIRSVLLEYRTISLEQEHELALCGTDIICLSKHLPYLAETAYSDLINSFFSDPALQQITDAEVQQLLTNINLIQYTSLVTYGVLTDENHAEAWQYAYSAYPEWAANSCAGLSGADCMTAFQTYQLHGYGGLVHMYHSYNSAVAMYTIGAGGAGVLVARSALVALATCASNPVCLNNLLATLPTTIGEAALGLSGASAGQAFITVGTGVLAGKLVFQHGDEILSVIDDAGRFFTPLSQEVDDAGRFLVRAADGTVGYLDEAGGFVVQNLGTGSKFADQAKLTDHFGRHGADFGATSASEYEQMADAFLTGPKGPNTLETVRPNGDIVRTRWTAAMAVASPMIIQSSEAPFSLHQTRSSSVMETLLRTISSLGGATSNQRQNLSIRALISVALAAVSISSQGMWLGTYFRNAFPSVGV